MTDFAFAGRVAASARKPQPFANNSPAVPKRQRRIASRRDSGKLPKFEIARAESRFSERPVERCFVLMVRFRLSGDKEIPRC